MCLERSTAGELQDCRPPVAYSSEPRLNKHGILFPIIECMHLTVPVYSYWGGCALKQRDNTNGT